MKEPSIDPEIDQLCDQFEREFKNGAKPKLEDFLKMVDENRRTAALYWLLNTKLSLLEAEQILSGREELLNRFPGDEETIELCMERNYKLLGIHPDIPGYELKEMIARGGQGGVYVATQVRTGQEVALKYVSGNRFQGEDTEATRQLQADFHVETRIVSMLRHPNSIRLYDGGICRGGAYLVMELIRGGNLADRRLQLNQYDAAELIRLIAEAVAEAHKFKILHLDIKPQNILFDQHTWQPRLVDFGLAKWEAIGKAADAIAGTPGYMAPEQASSGILDERTDIFGLGGTLYFLLTGRRPVNGESVAEILENSRHPRVAAPSSINPNVNELLERICMKCLETSPAGRYQSMNQLAEDLGRLKKRKGALMSVQMANGFMTVAIIVLMLNLTTAFLIWISAPEIFIWLAAFSIYIPFFSVFCLYPAPRTGSQTNTQEAIWAIWTAKFVGEILSCVALRIVIADVTSALKIAYPLFFAFSGMAVCCMGFHFWNRFYWISAGYWLLVPIVAYIASLDASLGPILYATTSIGIIIYSLHLKKVAKEIGNTTQPSVT